MTTANRPAFLDAWLRSGFPFTIAIIGVNFLTLTLLVFRVPVVDALALNIPSSLLRPWTIVTYPFLATGVMQALFHAIWLYFIGASLERSWGSNFYAKFFFAMTLASALGLAVGAFLLRTPVSVLAWMPIAAVTFAFCMINPEAEIRLYFLLPIKAKWLGWAELAIIFYYYAMLHPLLGIFALSGCGAAFLWVKARPWATESHHTRRPTNRFGEIAKSMNRNRPPDDKWTWRNLNPFEWIARKRRKKKFERLMKDD